MKKTLSILTISLLLGASWAMGQTASLAFDDGSGVANVGDYIGPNFSFSLTTSATFSGFSAKGLSYWLETEAGTASSFSITSIAYSTWTIGNQPGLPKSFNDISGRTNAGFLTEKGAADTGDLGGTDNANPQPAGTYPVTTLGFTVTGLAPGTYHLFTTTVGPKTSEVSDTGFNDHNVDQASYTINVIPEPATWSLMGLGGLGSFGLTWLRARRKS